MKGRNHRMFDRIRDMLRGARRIEIIILIIVLALIGLCVMDMDSFQDTSPATPLESRIRGILTCIDGVTDPQVMITEDAEGNITGIVIVAAGVSDMGVRLNVQKTITTLLDVELSQVEIINRREGDLQ